MLLTIKELKETYSDKDFSKYSDKRLERKLETIEIAIRKYCNNNFQDRNYRNSCKIIDNKVYYVESCYLEIGDTVQISVSKLNDGLYVVQDKRDGYLLLDKPLKDSIALITKIVYPLDVIDGAIELLDWDCNKSDKTDIASETISRHSVSYQSYDGNNTISGYPSRLFGFCKRYVKARV